MYNNQWIPQQSMMPANSNQRPPINQQQFIQWVPQINASMMNQLAAVARAQGMSEADINAGINFVQDLRR